MRINQFVARASGLSRRAADEAIASGRVKLNDAAPNPGHQVADADSVTLDGQSLELPGATTILLHKPVGFVCSRRGQGNRTVYDLLPAKFLNLKPVGRLDKDSSGLLLLTNDGDLAQRLTHPSFAKEKVYQVSLDKPLDSADAERLGEGIRLEDGSSRLFLTGKGTHWQVRLYEGRNRQIRRTFAAIGYTVVTLQRTQLGDYELGDLEPGAFHTV